MPDPTKGPQYWVTRINTELRGGDQLAQVLEALWSSHSGFAARARIQYLRTKRDAINTLLGWLDEQAENLPQEGDAMTRAQLRRANLLSIRQDVVLELSRTKIGGSGAVGQLATTVIIDKSAVWPWPQPMLPGDPNDTSYSGDPRKRAWPLEPPS